MVSAAGAPLPYGSAMLRLSFRGKSRQKSVSMPNWAFALMAAGSAALGIALFLVVSTIAVLLLPLVLMGGAIAAFVMRKRIEKMLKTAGFETATGPAPRKRKPRKPATPDIEDAEYRVVNDPKPVRRQPQELKLSPVLAPASMPRGTAR
jgi:hypothetical protein